MAFDYSALTGRIVEKYKTQYNFAIAMELSERSLSLKLNNKVSWKNAEIFKVCELLEIEENKIGRYFFKKEVQIF